MNSLLKLTIEFYHVIFGIFDWKLFDGAGELTEIWIKEVLMGPNIFFFIVVYMIIVNLLHLPRTYKWKVFNAPPKAQLFMRQILFYNIIVCPIFVFAFIFYTIARFKFYHLT